MLTPSVSRAGYTEKDTENNIEKTLLWIKLNACFV